MANLKVKNADGDDVYLAKGGAGTDIDPHTEPTQAVSGTVSVTGVSTAAHQVTAQTTLAAIQTAAEAIKTAVETLDNIVAGSEAQVDVLTLPNVTIGAAIPAGTNNIGDVDVLSIAAGSNVIGGTKDAGIHATTSLGVSSAVVTSADATTPVAVTDVPTGGQKLVIWDIIASSDTEMWLEFEEETSATILFKVYVAANTTVQITPRGKVKLATADKKLMVDAEAAGNIAVTVLYSSEA